MSFRMILMIIIILPRIQNNKKIMGLITSPLCFFQKHTMSKSSISTIPPFFFMYIIKKGWCYLRKKLTFSLYFDISSRYRLKFSGVFHTPLNFIEIGPIWSVISMVPRSLNSRNNSVILTSFPNVGCNIAITSRSSPLVLEPSTRVKSFSQ